MKDIEACPKPKLAFNPLMKRDMNIANNDRNHKICKLKADLQKVNINKPVVAPVQKPKTVRNPLESLRGVDLYKIREHLFASRGKNRVETDPLAKQTEINRMMRATLFNWLLEVAGKFQLNPRTIFLCAHVFDRFCATTNVQKSSLQLLGITCLYIASKFEDVQPPRIRDLCFLCNDIYKPDDILTLESDVLASLAFDLIFVSAYDVVEIEMALKGVFGVNTNKAIMFVLHTFLIQGTISMVDSFKLAGYTCTLVQGQRTQTADAGDISGSESEKLDKCLKQMLNVIKKYRLSGLEKEMTALPHGILLI